MSIIRTALRLFAAVAAVGSGLVFGITGPVGAATTPAITTISIAATNPTALGVDPRTNTIYVASNYSGSNMTVVNGTTDSTVTSFSLSSSGANSVTVDPTTDQVWVMAGSAHIITGATNALNGSLGVGTTPTGSTYDSANHRIYTGNDNNYRYLSVITGNTDHLITQTNLNSTYKELLNLAADPKSGVVYARSDSDGIAVYNSGTITYHSAGLCGTGPVAVDPTTNRLYLACTASNTVEVVNGSTMTLLSTIAVGTKPEGIAVNPVTGDVFVTDYGSSSVSMINGATDAVVKTVSVGTNPNGIAVDTTTNTVYVADSGSNELTVLKYPTSVPAAPQGVTAKATGTTSAYIRWTPPATNGGLPVTGYTVTASPGGKTCTTTATTCSIQGLTRGVSYSLTVAASNSDGTGVGAVSGSVTPSYTGSATIYLTAHCSTVTADPTTDMIYVGCQKGTLAVVEAVTGMSHALVGSVSLTPTTVTRISQLAVDARIHKVFAMVGRSPTGASLITITSLTLTELSTVGLTVYTIGCTEHDSPGGVAVDPADNHVFASIHGFCSGQGWTYFFTGATGKKLGVTGTGGGLGAAEFSPSSGRVFVAMYSTGMHVYTGSTDAAMTSVDTGEYANAIAIDTTTNTIYSVGQSPTRYHYTQLSIINGATYAKTTVRVATIRSVAVDPSVDRILLLPHGGATGEVGVFTGSAGVSVGTVPTNGRIPDAVAVDPATTTAYVVNTYTGSSSYDTSTLSVFTVPAPPGVSATAGNASATVDWSANTGGAPITSYTVTSSPGGDSCTTSSTSCTITGLTNGTTYTFSVTATNIMGTGSPGVSNPVTPELPPPTVEAPSTVSWAATLSGTNQLVPSTITATVHDTTPNRVWQLTANLAAVPSTPNGHHLGVVTAKCGAASAVTLTPGSPVTVCTGPGTKTETITLKVTVPANAYAGVYSATFAWKATP